jgi:hypothetical protein
MGARGVFGLFIVFALCWPVAAGAQGAQDSLQDKARQLFGTFGSGAPSGRSQARLGEGDIISGLREALRVGTERVVARLGRADGFNADPEVHIPLPEKLRSVQSALRRVGLSSMADDLELRLNRAAEAAAPKAKSLFWNAISEMSLEDARAIYNGPDDAATRYFQGKMSDPLAAAMRPVVDDSLSQVGAIRAYDSMMTRYKAMPFVPDVKADLTEHVLDRALAGMFLYLGREEAAIRRDPVKRTTEILRTVFGR